jgi:hypothetical protein
MRKIRTILALAAGAGLVFAGVSAAGAAPVSSLTCTGGAIDSGTYASINVTGDCYVPAYANVTVLGNIVVAPNASFNAESYGAALYVKGSVIGSAGSFVGLGCTEAHECENLPVETTVKSNAVKPALVPSAFACIVIEGNVVLNAVWDAAINGVLVKGNVVATGGGAGVSPEPFIPFSVKDNEIRGSLSVSGLRTSWFGAIRNTIYKNVTITSNRSNNPDSTEVVSNWIGGNLVCAGNTPKAQVGDSFGGPNYVGGVATGECASLTGVVL